MERIEIPYKSKKKNSLKEIFKRNKIRSNSNTSVQSGKTL